MFKTVILTFCMFLASCSTDSPSQGATPTLATTTPSPAMAKTENKVKDPINSPHEAIADFVSTNYAGWSLQGASGDSGECDTDVVCDLHLMKGKETKIIAVIVKEFAKADGTRYWFVFEARPIDLAHASRSRLLANLTGDDCEGVIQAVSDSGDYPTLDEDYSPYDPRTRCR